MIGLTHYLLLGAFLFAIGLFNALSKRNVIAVLMGVELMLNAVNMNLLAFNRFVGINGVDGYVFALIVYVVAATEVARWSGSLSSSITAKAATATSPRSTG